MLIYLLLTSGVILSEPFNLVFTHTCLPPSPTMLVTKTNSCGHPTSDLLRQDMGVFNQLPGKYGAASDNGVWK